MREGRLDLCVSAGDCPVGVDFVPLYDAPNYLVVGEGCPLAAWPSASLTELELFCAQGQRKPALAERFSELTEQAAGENHGNWL